VIFEALSDAATHGELLLVDGGMAHWHLCVRGPTRGQLTIREILVLPERRSQGIGSAMLSALEQVRGARYLQAVCPADLPAGAWYCRRGFTESHRRESRTGRPLVVFRKWLQHG
jgi:GNAT superfamily N-acetyltransferase